ncbi:MAG: hypothetical protein JXR05_02525 [Flavobacteriaceae bacterium]
MKKMKKAISLFLLMGTLYVSAQDSALLRYNLKKGDKYEVVLNMKQDMAPIMDMDITIKMLMESKGKDKENTKVASSFKRMAINMTAGGEEVKFDSDEKSEDMDADAKKMQAEIAPLLNMMIHQTMNKYGKIIDVKVVPEVKGASQFTDQAQLTSMVYPEKAVKVGSKWMHSQNISGMKMDGTYTVKKITQNRVFADFSGKLGSDDASKMTGNLEIDRNSGMILDMKLNMSMSQGGMSMKMNVTMKSKKVN